MSVPPTRRQQEGQPPSKSGPSESGNQKSFQLPGRKEQTQENKDEKKKGLFDLTQEEQAALGQAQGNQPGLDQEISESMTAAAEKAIPQTEAVSQVTQISQLIQQTVESMRIGQVGGKEFLNMDLKKGPEVPQAFEGSNLTVSYEVNGITIHFDNFMTPQQQNNAIVLVEQNKEQLQQMVEALYSKKIQVIELSIGSHVVNVPRVEGLPPPFQPITTAQPEQSRRQDQGQQGRQGQDQGEPQ